MLTRLWLLILLSNSWLQTFRRIHISCHGFSRTFHRFQQASLSRHTVCNSPNCDDKKYTYLPEPSRPAVPARQENTCRITLQYLGKSGPYFYLRLTPFATSENCHFCFFKSSCHKSINLSHWFCLWSVLLSSSSSCCLLRVLHAPSPGCHWPS